MEPFSVDADIPQQIAARVEQVDVSKATAGPLQIFVLAVLAGGYIALGAAFFMLVSYDTGSFAGGLLRLMAGLMFCLSLILVVVAVAELLSVNNQRVMVFVDGEATRSQLLKKWMIVYPGNFVGICYCRRSCPLLLTI